MAYNANVEVMENIEYNISEKNILTIKIDLSRVVGLTDKNNFRVASTLGNITFPNTKYHMGMTVFAESTKQEKSKLKKAEKLASLELALREKMII